MPSINKKMCTCHCGHTHQINEREIAMFKGLVEALWRILQWCEKTGRHEFDMKTVRVTLGRNEYARFGDWVYFGGLVYKRGKSLYGLNLPRVREFFAGRHKIPKSVFKSPITKQVRPGEMVWIHQIPKLTQFLDSNEQYIARYRDPAQSSFL